MLKRTLDSSIGKIIASASGEGAKTVVKSFISTSSTKMAETNGCDSHGKSSNSTNNPPLSTIESAKRNAAHRCVNEHVISGQLIGVGTGTTARYVVERLGERYRSGEIRDIVCVPSSFQSRRLILDNHLPLSTLEQHPQLDICIDGADEVDAELNCIKGGGGCLTQEKIVQSCSRRFLVIADFRKKVKHLGDVFIKMPLEVLPVAYVPVIKRIEAQEGGACQLRMAVKKAGPVITDNGNYVLDWEFPKMPRNYQDWTAIHLRLKLIPGIVETGLFLGVVERAYIGMEDGTVAETAAVAHSTKEEDHNGVSHGKKFRMNGNGETAVVNGVTVS